MAGGAVRALGTASLDLWVSEISAIPVDLDQLREHDAVIQRALRSATPLPLRFGTRFSSEADALSVLERRASEFVAMLERVADHVEMGLRILEPRQLEAAAVAEAAAPTMLEPRRQPAETPAGADPSPGRAYLEDRRRSLAEHAAREANLEERLASLEASFGGDFPAVRTVVGKGQVIGTLAHLVHRGELGGYREHVAELCRSRPDLRIELTGPWAPYSFARNE